MQELNKKFDFKRTNIIKKEIENFYKREFGKDLLFVIIYGSWAFELNNKNSDVDIVGICSKYNQKQMKNTISFVKRLHKENKLKFDEEVPYENKLLATPSFVEKAILGEGFKKNKNKVIIQPIVKTKKFLSSRKLSMRLLLNALTTKSIFCGGDKKKYKEIQSRALQNSVRIFYSAWEIKGVTLSYFIKNIIKRDGKTGQFYLGFDDNPKVEEYLRHSFKKTFSILSNKGIIRKINNKYFINNAKWFKDITLR